MKKNPQYTQNQKFILLQAVEWRHLEVEEKCKLSTNSFRKNKKANKYIDFEQELYDPQVFEKKQMRRRIKKTDSYLEETKDVVYPLSNNSDKTKKVVKRKKDFQSNIAKMKVREIKRK